MRGKDAVRLSEMKKVMGVSDASADLETVTCSFDSIPCMVS